MSKTNISRILVIAAGAIYLLAPPFGSSAVAVEEVTRKLAGEFDRTLLSEILRMPTTPDLMEALRKAFSLQKDRRNRQYIAAALVEMGEADPSYYNLLSDIAGNAITAQAPSWMRYDSEGNYIPGDANEEFRAWCLLNHIDLREGVARQVQGFEDVNILAMTRDSRATNLLVKGLKSRNELIVGASAQALALRNVYSAIPEIVAAAQRLPPGSSAWSIAQQLAIYGTPEADREMARFIKDPNKIAAFKKIAVMYRKAYDLNDRSRLGLSPANPAVK